MANTGNEAAREKKSYSIEVKIGQRKILSLNPVVSLLSSVIIWGFVIWCIGSPKQVLMWMSSAKSWISMTSTWFYIGSKNIWVVFVAIVYFSKYSNLKLGKDDDEPEYNDFTYFAMLFAAGVGIGLFYFGVSEPIFHYEPMEYGNRFWARYSDNQRAQDAINITFFHWGLHAWIVYVIVGLLLAFVSHRNGLPMTIRSCFHPLLGDSIYGVIGDIIDTLSVVGTMFGVCTSLGLGVMTLNTGLNRINSDIEKTTTNQIIIIWVITAIATVSVVAGLKVGIRRLSEICFAIGMFLMLFVMFRSDTWYFLNVYVQGIGYYLQYLFQLGSHTEAFAQLGNAPDGKESPKWMENWTIFYWGWWISWSPYVGMFIAKISRGRTIKNFLMYTLTAPMLYTFFWFSIFGGAGLIMERNAALKGINCTSVLGGRDSTEPYEGLYRLSCRGSAQMYFDVMQGFNDDLTPFLYVISLISITLYFVTSSDSGSLVIDCLSANGSPEPPVLQRVFWALTEGACATALLTTGGTDALVALQTVSIIAGLPYTVVICFMCVSLWRALTADTEPRVDFVTGIFHVFTHISLQTLVALLVAIFAPWYHAGRASGKVYSQKPWYVMTTIATLFYGWILLEFLELAVPGLAYVGWAILMGFFAYLTGIRMAVRQKYGIQGNMFQDFLIVMFLLPFAVDQMDRQMMYERAKKDDGDDINMADLGKDSSENDQFLQGPDL